VIYTIMRDEQRRQRPKEPRPFGLRRKSPPDSPKGFDRIADMLFAFLLPERAILPATRLTGIMSFDPRGGLTIHSETVSP
jgi:hypothetical protein